MKYLKEKKDNLVKIGIDYDNNFEYEDGYY